MISGAFLGLHPERPSANRRADLTVNWPLSRSSLTDSLGPFPIGHASSHLPDASGGNGRDRWAGAL